MKRFVAGYTLACVLLICSRRASAQQPAPQPEGAPQAAPEGEANPVPQFDYTKLSPPPPLPRVVDVRQPGENGFSLGAAMWFANPKPYFDRGDANFTPYPANIRMLGRPKFDQGFEATVAVSHHDSIKLSYFTSQASGGGTINQAVQLWEEIYPSTNFVDRNYRLKNVKFSLEYLTWPYPVKTSRFRLKTLWQLQYTNIRAGFDAPYVPLYDSSGNLQFDASGNLITFNTQGTSDFWTPSIGVATEYWVNRGFRLEASASGFAIPHHTNTWDIDGTANFRIGHYELRLGVKAYHFRTSSKSEFWMRGTMVGPYIGLRLYSD